MQILESSPKATSGFVSQAVGAMGAALPNDEEDARWQLALRIAESGSLGRSELLSNFLLYVVDRSIRGRTDEITEQQIGVHVFGRPDDYDPNDDNIVRSYARKLRKRIEEYFASDGCAENIRLEIPRGGYTPIFSSNVFALPTEEHNPHNEESSARIEPAATEITEVPNPVPAESRQRIIPCIRKHSHTAATFLFGLLLGMGLFLLGHVSPIQFREEALSHTLWMSMFNKDQDTFIVPSDDGLIIMQHYADRPVPLTAYVNGSYRNSLAVNQSASEIFKLSGRRYTNVVDLDFAAHLALLKEIVPKRMMIRYARDLRMDDLRAGSAILIGSDESNPWIELFRPQLYFRFQYEPDPDKPSGFVNLHPRAGELKMYTTKGQEDQTYGIIAYLPNLSNTGHVLIVAGLNTAGTQAATAFLLDSRLMKPTLERAETDHGELQPFELLVASGNVATNASTPQIVLERIGLPREDQYKSK